MMKIKEMEKLGVWDGLICMEDLKIQMLEKLY